MFRKQPEPVIMVNVRLDTGYDLSNPVILKQLDMLMGDPLLEALFDVYAKGLFMRLTHVDPVHGNETDKLAYNEIRIKILAIYEFKKSMKVLKEELIDKQTEKEEDNERG